MKVHLLTTETVLFNKEMTVAVTMNHGVRENKVPTK